MTASLTNTQKVRLQAQCHPGLHPLERLRRAQYFVKREDIRGDALDEVAIIAGCDPGQLTRGKW